MSAEPDNIEQQLQAYAQRRREEAGTPFELHPSTRRLLQGEVARTYAGAPAPAAAKPGLLAALWLRLALGGGVCAVLALVLMLGPSARRQPAVQMAAQPQTPSPSADIAAMPEREVARTTPPSAVRPEVSPVTGEPVAPAPRLAATPAEPAAAGPATGQPAAASRLADSSPTLDPMRMLAQERGAAEQFKESQRRGAASLPPPPPPPSAPVVKRDSALEVASVPVPAITPMVKATAGAPAADGSKLAEVTKSAPSGPPDSFRADRTAGQLATSAALKAEADKAKRLLADAEAKDMKKTQATGRAVTFTSTAELQTAADAKAKLALGQRFQQLAAPEKYRRNFNSPPLPQVLNTFQIEQAGSQVRITDEDGSLYLGELTQPEAAEPPRPALQPSRRAENVARQKAAAEKAVGQSGETYFLPAGQTLHFRAAGTNFKLNQTVVIEGTFLNYSNASPAGAPSPALPTQPAAQGFRQLPLDKLQVQGRAVIGGNNEIPINAVPAKP